MLDNLPDDIDLTIVGGRALEYWVEVYSLIYPDEFKGSRLSATVDIDFVIKEMSECRKCAQHWIPILKKAGIEAAIDFPTMDDFTAEAAVIKMKVDGTNKRYAISDFLFQLSGINKNQIHSNREDLGRGLCVLTPYMVLCNRVYNVINLRSKQDDHGLSQLENAMIISKCYIRSQLEKNTKSSIREALKTHNLIVNMAKSKKVGVKLYRDHDFDLINALCLNHPNLPSSFLSKGWPNQKSAIISSRDPSQNSTFEP